MSEVHTASITILMVEAVCISVTLVYFMRLHGDISQKAATFILATLTI
jgi:heme/copper-type cytochrome/quinol oxidase subunit 4